MRAIRSVTLFVQKYILAAERFIYPLPRIILRNHTDEP